MRLKINLVLFDDFKLGVVDVSDAVNSILHQELHELINWLIAGFLDHKQ